MRGQDHDVGGMSTVYQHRKGGSVHFKILFQNNKLDSKTEFYGEIADFHLDSRCRLNVNIVMGVGKPEHLSLWPLKDGISHPGTATGYRSDGALATPECTCSVWYRYRCR
jgi:hypothetical protein